MKRDGEMVFPYLVNFSSLTTPLPRIFATIMTHPCVETSHSLSRIISPFRCLLVECPVLLYSVPFGPLRPQVISQHTLEH